MYEVRYYPESKTYRVGTRDEDGEFDPRAGFSVEEDAQDYADELNVPTVYIELKRLRGTVDALSRTVNILAVLLIVTLVLLFLVALSLRIFMSWWA